MPAIVQSSPAPILPETGFLRLADVLKLVPVCKTAWYNGIRSGDFPPARGPGQACPWLSCGRCACPDRPSQCRTGGVA